ncbi:MAG: type II secretion system F family protein, partial [bacterium]
MPKFSYVAITEEGKEVKGNLDAADQLSVERSLESQNLFPIRITKGEEEVATVVRSSPIGMGAQKSKRRRISQREIIDFTRQLMTLIKAGVPILTALETLAGQSSNPAFAEVIVQVATDISSGSDLSQALSKHPKVFSELYCAAVRAGETGGVLDEVLGRLTAVLQRDWEIRKEVKGALRYPIMVITGMIIAFLILTTFVVPKFAAVYAQINMELPLPTKLLIGLSEILRSYWWAFGLIVGGIIFGFTRYIKTEKGRIWWDNTLLRLPIFGPLVLKSAMTRFTKMFETLSRAGLPILQIFQVVARTLGNRILEGGILQAAESLERGKAVSTSLAETGLFPPLVVRMIAVGEESGALDEMLANVGDYYDMEVKTTVEGLTAMIEPLLTVGLGAVVLVFALAIFLPMW